MNTPGISSIQASAAPFPRPLDFYRSQDTSGQPTFIGFNYQVLATVWLALEFIVRQGAPEVIVERPSKEDVTAELKGKNPSTRVKTSKHQCCYVNTTLMGVMAGRQEFADGPRQLISLSDGPNMHRTWNGLRFYTHGERFRLGAFDLRATRLESGLFDEELDRDERIQGLIGSMVISPGRNLFLDPFWIHSENPNVGSADHMGFDNRNTYGVRVWGRRGGLRFDWTVARQTGESIDHDVDAWGLFAVQSLALSEEGWKPRLTTHIDIASGGSGGRATGEGFNHLYASSNYLGEGRFLSLSNLLLIAPGISVSPTPATNISLEYGFARRLTEHDAAYAGGMRAYPGTQNVRGHEIGGLLRIAGNWSVTEYLTLSCDFEHLAAGDVLKRARLHSGSYGYIGATFRF